MFAYLVRRIGSIVPTLIFVSMLIFGLQQLLPGDPAIVLAGEERDPNVVAYLREKMHLDEPGDRLGFRRGKAQPRCHIARDARTRDRMVLDTTLGDVVQE